MSPGQRIVMKKRLATHREHFEAASPYHVAKSFVRDRDGEEDTTATVEPPPFLIVHGNVRADRRGCLSVCLPGVFGRASHDLATNCLCADH
jgi:hypothetical protein